MKYWISVHGAPKRLFSDNGGEFNAQIVRDMCENFNIQVVTTAGYSPWSNGICERHNMIITETLQKIMDSHACDIQTAFCWAIMAKNCLHNVNGFSPYQIAFGRNPNLPSVLDDQLPALEGETVSEVVGKHINAMHHARQAFIKAECSDKIRRALRKQTRNYDESCQAGDRVYYKRPDSESWKGPGTVIGCDGPIVFVRHGGALVKVHKCSLRKVNQNDKSEDVINNIVDVNVSNNSNKHDEMEFKVSETCNSGDSNDTDNCRRSSRPKSKPKWMQDFVEGSDEEVMITENIDMAFAKQTELDSWVKNDVYEEVQFEGQKLISTRWVCTLKSTEEGIKSKARLVARGFEEYTLNVDKDSPTCAHESLRLILAVLAQNSWKVNSMDIKTAFLQGKPIDRDVYIRPPKEANTNSNVVWKLKKNVSMA